MRFYLFVFCLSVCASQIHAQQSKPNLDELQRQLEAKKAQQAREARINAQPAIIVKSNSSCRLSVNGEDKGVIETNRTLAVKQPPGATLVTCDSLENSSVQYEEAFTLETSGKIISIDMQALLDAPARAAAEEARRQSEQQNAYQQCLVQCDRDQRDCMDETEGYDCDSSLSDVVAECGIGTPYSVSCARELTQEAQQCRRDQRDDAQQCKVDHSDCREDC